MSKYPNKLYVLIDNMIKLHFDYDNIFEQISISFPTIHITYDEMLDIIQDRIIKMI